MPPKAVMTMTGSSGSSVLGGLEHAEAVADRQAADRTARRPARCLLQALDRFGLVARFDDVMALRLERVPQHRAQRVLVFDEEDRCAAAAARSPSQPARRDAGLARFFLDVGDGLGLLGDFFLHAIELGDRALPLELELRALRRVVAVDEVGGERVDPALQRVGENLAALERGTRGVDPRAPVRLIFVPFGRGGSALPPGRLTDGTCVLGTGAGGQWRPGEWRRAP